MNPVKNIMAEAAPWDIVGHTAGVKQPAGEFGRFFDTARLDMGEPVRSRGAERSQFGQDRQERINLDQSKPVPEPERAPVEAAEPQENLEADRNQRSEAKVDDGNQREQQRETTGAEETKGSETTEAVETAEEVAVQPGIAAPKNPEVVLNVLTEATTGEKSGQQSGQAGELTGLNNKSQNQPKGQPSTPQASDSNTKVNDDNSGTEKTIQNNKDQGQSSKLSALKSEAKEQGVGIKAVVDDGGKNASAVKPEEHQKPAEGADKKIDMTVQGKSSVDNQTAKSNSEGSFNANREAGQQSGEKLDSVVVSFSGRSALEGIKPDQGLTGNTLMNQGESGVSGKIPTPNNLSSVLNVGKPEAAGSTEMQENVDRIVKAARVSMNNGSARIQIRLEPPELGYLRVEIKQSGNGWHLQMQATNVKAQQLLQQNSSELQAALESHGIQARQIEVQLRLDLSDDHTAGEQQDAYNQQSSSQDTDSYDQSQDDGSGQGGPESSSANEGEEEVITAVETSDTKQWREMEFSRLDVQI